MSPPIARGEALRDRYFALAREGATDEAFLAEVDRTPAVAACEVEGLGLAWHPTRAHKALRFVPWGKIPAALRDRFASPLPELPELAGAFVAPDEISLFDFENIVALDRLFVAPRIAFREATAPGPGVELRRFECDDATAAALRSLDGLGLYAAPLDPEQRGGRRFVFHAAALASALGDALRAALPEEQRRGFSHVNPVFRCSAFEPSDARFRWHQDTPYHDPARRHLSRTTLVLYLTAGRGEPLLSFEGGTRIDALDAFTGVLFDQRLAHEGAPFLEGRKVFVRTELVFAAAEDELRHVPEVGALFGRASYFASHLSARGPFAAELARWASDAYDRSARAHFGAEPAGPPASEPLLHKTLGGASWITNGHDFWFPERAPVAECAAIAIADLLNLKVSGAAVRARATTCVLEDGDRAAIPALLGGGSWASPVAPLDAEARSGLLPPPEEPDREQCCPMHASPFDPSRSEEVIDAYRSAQQAVRDELEVTPLVVLGRDLHYVPEAFVVRGDKIHVLSDRRLPPMSFAAAWACWSETSGPAEWVRPEREVTGLELLVPPIPFARWRGCHHLMLDVFRNDWVLAKEAPIAIPYIAPKAD